MWDGGGKQVVKVQVAEYREILKNATFGLLVLKHATLKMQLQPMPFFDNEFDRITLFFLTNEKDKRKKDGNMII